MNNSQTTAETIEFLAKSKGVSVSKMLADLGMNKNALFTMKNSGYLPRVESLCKFAEYFNVSIDFLIGRSDKPDMNTTVTQTGGFIESSPISVVNSPEKNAPVKELDEMTIELIRAFKALSFKDKMEIMNAVMKKSQK
jgi:transcriptional regulator with XRE-family HTH domain